MRRSNEGDYTRYHDRFLCLESAQVRHWWLFLQDYCPALQRRLVPSSLGQRNREEVDMSRALRLHLMRTSAWECQDTWSMAQVSSQKRFRKIHRAYMLTSKTRRSKQLKNRFFTFSGNAFWICTCNESNLDWNVNKPSFISICNSVLLSVFQACGSYTINRDKRLQNSISVSENVRSQWFFVGCPALDFYSLITSKSCLLLRRLHGCLLVEVWIWIGRNAAELLEDQGLGRVLQVFGHWLLDDMLRLRGMCFAQYTRNQHLANAERFWRHTLLCWWLLIVSAFTDGPYRTVQRSASPHYHHVSSFRDVLSYEDTALVWYAIAFEILLDKSFDTNLERSNQVICAHLSNQENIAMAPWRINQCSSLALSRAQAEE